MSSFSEYGLQFLLVFFILVSTYALSLLFLWIMNLLGPLFTAFFQLLYWLLSTFFMLLYWLFCTFLIVLCLLFCTFLILSSNGSAAVPMLATHEWYFKEDDGSWVKFDIKGNTENTSAIERKFQSDPKTKFKFSAGNQSYVLNFITMTQTNTSTGKVREVRRLNQTVSLTGSSPSNAQISSGQKCSTMSLPANHAEYTKVLKLLKTTLPNCNPISIVKINNPYLETAFKNRKIQLQNQYPSVMYKEEYLFHGTEPANVKAILEDNLDWRLHGSCTGHKYGRGAYFSNSAKMSRDYGKAIFVCRVLVGLTARGEDSTLKPPKDGFNRLVDTTVDDVAKPTIFVKYETQEYYPEYYAVFSASG
ncbi:protein mono-ADP-ribosyltransferase PARP12-like [Hyalella azteca]|uniref:Poly [ADP-ribose] polymerase n=1 Tax=Hyalella azteca TaxID=294128 RepID=A0A8B7NI07_HYAAZ|nr:protein mono-ADP-ribosyltransferase PARP12-like [Hyalella azteca]XP_018012997.1 protein mono-ADP-ribosyltransferase PARP12-like [Hyalella azteca]XP_047739576.1 protein mono-ADP-ribosyltransferase PARP12-like [Hyalella azteca]